MKAARLKIGTLQPRLTDAQRREKDVASCSLLQSAIARQRYEFRLVSVSPGQQFCGIVAPKYRNIRRGCWSAGSGRGCLSRPVFFSVPQEREMMTSTLTYARTGNTVIDAHAGMPIGADIPTKTRKETYDDTPSDSLSDRLRERGHDIDDSEAVLLNVAQTLCKTFRDGTPVSFTLIRRIVKRYHGESRRGEHIEAIARRLTKSGICSLDPIGRSIRRLRLLDHFGSPNRPNSRFYDIVDGHEMHEALLMACRHSVAYFHKQNVATRVAVKYLMMARYGLNKYGTNKLIRELIAADVLEIAETKGQQGLRLTLRASMAVCGRNDDDAEIECEAVA